MFKVYVFIFGLVTIIPNPNGQGVIALLLDTSHLQYSTGFTAAPHSATALLTGESSSLTFKGEDLTFTPSGDQAKYSPNLREKSRFTQLASLYGTAKTKPGCIGAKPVTECLIGGQYPLLSGRVQLVGGWTLRPIEILKGVPVPGKQDRSVWGFHTLDLTASHLLQGSYATGFQFEITVSNLAAVSVLDGASKYDLKPASPTQCRGLDESAPNCTVILVRNLPSPMGSADDDDQDFELYYYLLDTAPGQRYIPTLVMKDVSSAKGSGNPPGSKCFGTVLEP